MADLRLSVCISSSDRIASLMTGEVKPEGITLEFAEAPSNVNTLFYQQLKFNRFDLSEMSFSSFLRARGEGWGYRAIPVFHNRGIVYPSTTIRLASGIRQDHPEDLKGKRFILGYYVQTAGLWTRGILQHEFGVMPQDIEWYEAPGRYIEHGGEPPLAQGFPQLGVKSQISPKEAGAMFREGLVDAGLSFRGTGDPAFPTLFSDPKAEAFRFREKWGIFPAHHTTIVRESIVEEYPWVATSLVTAFTQAKALAMQRVQRPPSLMLYANEHMRDVESVFGSDPWAYGLHPNRKVIDTAQTFSFEQGLTKRKQPWDELFAEEALISEDWNPDWSLEE